MRKGEKRGLSPVIATVLLIAVALVLATVIFFWAKSFIGEQIEKGGQKIELVCEQVAFRAEATAGLLYIENIGSIPIYSVEMNLIGAGEIKEIGSPENGNIAPGETASFSLPTGANVGDRLIIVPILLGESVDEGDYVAKICDEDYGVETEVRA